MFIWGGLREALKPYFWFPTIWQSPSTPLENQSKSEFSALTTAGSGVLEIIQNLNHRGYEAF